MALRLFKKWQGQSLGWHIAKCQKVEKDSDFPMVLCWYEAGEKFSFIFRFISQKNLFTWQGRCR